MSKTINKDIPSEQQMLYILRNFQRLQEENQKLRNLLRSTDIIENSTLLERIDKLKKREEERETYLERLRKRMKRLEEKVENKQREIYRIRYEQANKQDMEC